MHFFWPNLRCKVIEQMVKSRYLVEFPAQKKEPKWFQNLGHFKKNSSAQWPKKSPKNWTGPCLSLNMVRRNRFIKWQTPARNAKSSFEGANPTPPSPMQRRRPPARTTIESKRTVVFADRRATARTTTFVEPCSIQKKRMESKKSKHGGRNVKIGWHTLKIKVNRLSMTSRSC